jgi:hypothetical protein
LYSLASQETEPYTLDARLRLEVKHMLKGYGQTAGRGLPLVFSCWLALYLGLIVPIEAQQRLAHVYANVTQIQAPIGRPLMKPIVIYVEDQDGRRIPGAVVILTMPASGASATFLGGQTSLMLTTGPNGTVTLAGFTPNNIPGNYEIAIKASYQGLGAANAIKVENVRIGLGPGSRASKWIVAATAVAAVTVTVLVGTGRIGGDPGPSTTPTVITIGAPGVGSPQ